MKVFSDAKLIDYIANIFNLSFKYLANRVTEFANGLDVILLQRKVLS